MKSCDPLQSAGTVNATMGGFTIAGSLLFYWAFTSSFPILNDRLVRMFSWLSYFTFLLMILGVVMLIFGLNQFLWARRVGADASSPLSVVLANVLCTRKYFWSMVVISLLYGVFYASVSSIIVYRPMENFAAEYFAVIPSVVPTVCCAGPGFIPVLTIYLTEHLGLLLIPANILLMIVVSGLVGVNTVLALYTFENRPKRAGAQWFGGFGAITGLFTACPTCAGLFLGNLIQSAGLVSATALLASYQPIFIAVTFPLLLASVMLMTRRLRQALYGTCAVIRSPSNKTQ